VNIPHPTGPIGNPRGVGFGIFMYIVTLTIYSYYWSFVTFDEMKRHTGDGIGGAMGLILHILLYGIPMYFLAPSEVGRMYAADGRPKPVQGTTGFWILLPIAGGIVWYVKVQGALNRYWESKGASEPQVAAPETA
jgi:Domain of unknown function (DUF4234)